MRPWVRNRNGRFQTGTCGGPGRPRRAVEMQYLTVLHESCSLSDWSEICLKAVADAKAGNHRAREWLARHMLGEPDDWNEVDDSDGALTLESFLDELRLYGYVVTPPPKGLPDFGAADSIAPDAISSPEENDRPFGTIPAGRT